MSKQAYGNNAKATAFLDEIIEVYEKHGLAISHEDEQGAFIVKPLEDFFVQWILDAQDATKEAA